MGPENNSNLTKIVATMQSKMGEQTANQQLYQKQLATTMAKLLGLQFLPAHPVGEAIY
jgi:hypothetical protein